MRTETSRASLSLAHVGWAQPHLSPSPPRLCGWTHGSPEVCTLSRVGFSDPKIAAIHQDLFPGSPAEALTGTVQGQGHTSV